MANKRKIIDRLKAKYKLVILNDETFEEKASLTLNPLSVFVVVSSLSIILISLTTFLLVFTPLKEYVPGFNDISLRRDVTIAFAKTDSLEREINARDIYLDNIRRIISGEVGPEVFTQTANGGLKIDSVKLNREPTKTELELRQYVEDETKFSVDLDKNSRAKGSIMEFTFFPPIKGSISQPYSTKDRHLAVDVTAKKNEPIKATLDGTVFFAGFTTDEGNVIGIQHANNIVSFYKHCSVIIKKVGSFVKAGEIIGVVGNSGELTTGPHLHFELWYNGSPINPSEHIKFN